MRNVSRDDAVLYRAFEYAVKNRVKIRTVSLEKVSPLTFFLRRLLCSEYADLGPSDLADFKTTESRKYMKAKSVLV